MNDALMLTVASEINQAHHQAIAHADKAIGFAQKAGELLLKVKNDLPHGEFLPWVESNLEVTPRQAQRYMAAAQGKPTPVRKLASNATPVSYLTTSESNLFALKLAAELRAIVQRTAQSAGCESEDDLHELIADYLAAATQKERSAWHVNMAPVREFALQIQNALLRSRLAAKEQGSAT